MEKETTENAARRNRAQVALRAYRVVLWNIKPGCDEVCDPDDITDLVTDLLHLARKRKQSPESVCRKALMNENAERVTR